jgi:hypothetical protein
MTKISNRDVYREDLKVNELDFVVGSDYDNSLRTVNFRVRELADFIGKYNGTSPLNFVFFFQPNDEQLVPPNGYFFSKLNITQGSLIQELYFSKRAFSAVDVTKVFDFIKDFNSNYRIRLSNPNNPNNFMFLNVVSATENTDYYTLVVSHENSPEETLFEDQNTYILDIVSKGGGLSITNTSELTNDGSDGTSTYVETDELGQVAFSNDYNDLDNLPTIPVVSTLLREEFVFSGSQTFTLTNNYAQVYSVEVQGQGALSTSQYTLVAPNQVTINDTLGAGDYVVIIYSDASAGVVPYYTQAQTDAGFIATVPNFVYVRDVNDFPPITLDKYFLEDDKTYHLAGTIDLNGARLVGGSNTTIIGGSSENGILTSTGLPIGVPLLSSIYTTPIRHISFKDVHTAIEFDGSTNPNDMALDWTGVNFVNVPNVGLIKDASNFIFDKGAFLDSKNLKFDGTIDTVGFGNCLFSGDGLLGNIIELADTCTINRRFRIIYSSVVAFALTKGIKVNPLTTIGIEAFILDTVNFSGGGTYLDGINYTNEEALFVNCVGIINTTAIANMYMKNNATPTTISVIGDRYAMSGTTQSNGVK